MKRYLIPLSALLLSLSMLAGCAASSHDTAVEEIQAAASSTAAADNAHGLPMEEKAMVEETVAMEMDVADDAAVAPVAPNPGTGLSEEGISRGADVQAEDRKLVYNVDLSLQTTTFDEGVERIPQITESLGGYIQSTYVEGADMFDKYYSRSANFTARIPTDNLETFLSSLGENFHLVYQQNSVDDISGEYYDVQARLNSLRIQSERLTAMLETATELEYLLQVEQQLASVQYEIDVLTASINRMDHQVDYSTVTIHLQEVNEYEDGEPIVQPITFAERIEEALGDSWKGFVEFLQDAIIFLIVVFPFLLILVVILIVIVLVRRKRKQRIAMKKAPTPSPVTESKPDDNTPEA